MRDRAAFRTELSPDSALRIAETQLQLHRYALAVKAQGVLMTTGRPIPQEVANQPGSHSVRLWVLRVDAIHDPLSGLTDVTVSGYLAPATLTPETLSTVQPGAKRQPGEQNRQRGQRQAADTIEVGQAIPITSDNPQLFGEIEAVTTWIRDATRQQERHR
jgi:hypothetical protein